MARTFTFRLKRSPHEILRELSRLVNRENWVLKGTTTRGSFSDSVGLLKGRYVVGKKTVEVKMVKKPSLSSWEEIEHWLAGYFGEILKNV